MFDTWFDQRPHDEDTTSPEEEQILKDFFDEKIPAAEAARNLTLAVGSEWDPDASKIFGLLLDAAEEIPASHTKLVELLAAIKGLGGMAYKLSYGQENYWINLPGVEMMMGDTRRCKLEPHRNRCKAANAIPQRSHPDSALRMQIPNSQRILSITLSSAHLPLASLQAALSTSPCGPCKIFIGLLRWTIPPTSQSSMDTWPLPLDG